MTTTSCICAGLPLPMRSSPLNGGNCRLLKLKDHRTLPGVFQVPHAIARHGIRIRLTTTHMGPTYPAIFCCFKWESTDKQDAGLFPVALVHSQWKEMYVPHGTGYMGNTWAPCIYIYKPLIKRGKLVFHFGKFR